MSSDNANISSTTTSVGSPVFICGHAKSGTTLLGALLDSHSDIAVFPEETFYLNYVRNHRLISPKEGMQWLLGENSRKYPTMGTQAVYDGWSFPYFESLETFHRRFEAHIPADNARHSDVLEALVSAYVEETRQSGKKYWLEKTHGNEQHLRSLLTWYPGVTAIYIVRDPRDVYVSWTRRMERSNKPHSIEKFIYRWGMSIFYWQQYSGLLANQLLIRYEDLVCCPEAVMKLLCAALDINFEPILERPTKNGKLWTGNSMHKQEFNGISAKPVGRWREHLAERDLALIETYLGKLMLNFGYGLSSTSSSLLSALTNITRSPEKRRILGMLVRAYWPFRLPARLQA